MPRILKGLAVALLIFTFFCLMSKIDSIVHRTLYNYGLKFSYQWANEYWLTYNATFFAFSIIMAVTYWLGSSKTLEDLKVSAGLSATVIILAVGGLQDILFYALWGNGLPPNDVVWWWMPWNGILGAWFSSMQVALVVSALSITALLWVRILRR
jgi:hypothetical protein